MRSAWWPDTRYVAAVCRVGRGKPFRRRQKLELGGAHGPGLFLKNGKHRHFCVRVSGEGFGSLSSIFSFRDWKRCWFLNIYEHFPGKPFFNSRWADVRERVGPFALISVCACMCVCVTSAQQRGRSGATCWAPRRVTKWIPYHLKAELPHAALHINTHTQTHIFNSSIHQHLKDVLWTNTQLQKWTLMCMPNG